MATWMMRMGPDASDNISEATMTAPTTTVTTVSIIIIITVNTTTIMTMVGITRGFMAPEAIITTTMQEFGEVIIMMQEEDIIVTQVVEATIKTMLDLFYRSAS